MQTFVINIISRNHHTHCFQVTSFIYWLVADASIV